MYVSNKKVRASGLGKGSLIGKRLCPKLETRASRLGNFVHYDVVLLKTKTAVL